MKLLICASESEGKKLSGFAARSLGDYGEAELVADSAFVRSAKKKAPGSFVYFDSSLGDDRILELASKLDDVEDCAWGVLDRTGVSIDPASFFFAGASDYVGPTLFKAGLGPGRLQQALDYSGLGPDGEGAAPTEDESEPFPGWAELAEGVEVPVRFCYAAIGDQRGLLEMIGEKRLGKLRDDFAAFLESWSKECGGIMWIRDPGGCLLLFPPKNEGLNPILAAFRLLLDRALIGYEVFKLEVPLTFRFAFHAGRTMWRRPGATGNIVSEDVNYAFHLGTKAAGDGYILVSREAERAIPGCIADLFSGAGDFEGRALVASRRFKD
jgi:hypothetical protein